jgi:hypothetical protein
MNHNLHREGAKDAKQDKSKRKNAVFRNKISFSSFFSSSLRPRRFVAPSGARLRGANFLILQHSPFRKRLAGKCQLSNMASIFVRCQIHWK